MFNKLRGKVGIVTGGGMGIGRGIAEAYANNWANFNFIGVIDDLRREWIQNVMASK